MKALEMLRARKNNSVTAVTSEKNAVVTAQPLIDKAVTSEKYISENDFSDFLSDTPVIVKICNECDFFIPDKINPFQGMGSCKLGINRKNKPLYPM